MLVLSDMFMRCIGVFSKGYVCVLVIDIFGCYMYICSRMCIEDIVKVCVHVSAYILYVWV